MPAGAPQRGRSFWHNPLHMAPTMPPTIIPERIEHAWVSGDVSVAKFDEFPHAIQHINDGSLNPCVPLLYHGHPTSAALEQVLGKKRYAKATLYGRVNAVQKISIPERGLFVLVAGLECDAAAQLHARLCIDVRAATGEEPVMKPHVGVDGTRLYPFDYRAHFILAKYDSAEAMDADYINLDWIRWIGEDVTIGPFRLH